LASTGNKKLYNNLPVKDVLPLSLLPLNCLMTTVTGKQTQGPPAAYAGKFGGRCLPSVSPLFRPNQDSAVAGFAAYNRKQEHKIALLSVVER
jgi:hypothetical protein